MGDNGVVRAFATSLQLLPSLLGFPIALTRPDSIITAPDPAPGPGREPRLEQLSYKGAMLDGLQASRMLHNEQAPGKHAASWQGQTQVSLPQAGMSNSVELHPAAFHLCVTSLAGLCAWALLVHSGQLTDSQDSAQEAARMWQGQHSRRLHPISC